MSAPPTSATILIVDDDQVTREVLVDLLARYDYSILQASNGSDGYQLAIHHHPDLILLDIMMPGMSGFEVCKQLRDHPDLASIPILMISALDDREARLEALRLGVDDILAKPFNAVELQLRVRTIARLNRYRRLWEERQRRERAEAALRMRDRELGMLETLLFSTALITIDDLEALVAAASRLLDSTIGIGNIDITLYRAPGDQRPIRAGTLGSDQQSMANRQIQTIPIQTNHGVLGQIRATTAEQPANEASHPNLLQAIASILGHAVDRSLLATQVRNLISHLEETVAERTAELRSERDRTNAILEAIGEAVVVISEQGLVQYANPAALQACQRSSAQVIGNAWGQLFQLNAAELLAQARATAEQGELWHDTVVIRRSDGSYYDAAITIAPLYTPNRQAIGGFVSVQRDISALRAAERLKDQFLANISHELRTPLSVITLHSGNLETLYSQLSDERRIALIREIRSQARLLTDLLSSVLDLVRTGQPSPLQRSPIHLAELVGNVLHHYEALAHSKGLDLEQHLHSQIVVLGDERRLRQAIGNLIGNAIKYTPDGGQIVLQLDEQRKEGSQVALIHIRDTGPGIAESDLPHVFERFYRANPESAIPGIGLGLAIAAEIMHEHGGTIMVESQLGSGSTFTLQLPIYTC